MAINKNENYENIIECVKKVYIKIGIEIVFFLENYKRCTLKESFCINDVD